MATVWLFSISRRAASWLAVMSSTCGTVRVMVTQLPAGGGVGGVAVTSLAWRTEEFKECKGHGSKTSWTGHRAEMAAALSLVPRQERPDVVAVPGIKGLSWPQPTCPQEDGSSRWGGGWLPQPLFPVLPGFGPLHSHPHLFASHQPLQGAMTNKGERRVLPSLASGTTGPGCVVNSAPSSRSRAAFAFSSGIYVCFALRPGHPFHPFRRRWPFQTHPQASPERTVAAASAVLHSVSLGPLPGRCTAAICRNHTFSNQTTRPRSAH